MPDFYSVDGLRADVRSAFQAAGSNPEEAGLIADHLVDANLAGHDSHGVIRMGTYLDWLKAGKVHANTPGSVIKNSGSIVVYDGANGYGQVVGHRALDLGIEAARRYGVSMTALRNSGHLGRIGAWAEKIADAGLLSIIFVNTTGLGMWVAPFGGIDRKLSANPIAAGAPVPGSAPLILDVSTSTVAEGKVQVARNKKAKMPPGAIIDAKGRPTIEPDDLYAGGALTAFGEHKGYGLGVFCEIFAGSLTGGHSTHPENPNAKWLVNNLSAIIIDPYAVVDSEAYAKDIRRLSDWIKSARPIDPARPVLLPGDIERATRRQRLEQGIPLDDITLEAMRRAATSFGASLQLLAA